MKASIITKHEDFLVFVIPILTKFPSKYKFFLAGKIENRLLDILELLIEAYYKRRNAKRDILIQVNIEIEKTRHLIRLCYSLEIFHFKRYNLITSKLDEIGRMNGAWLKSLTVK